MKSGVPKRMRRYRKRERHGSAAFPRRRLAGAGFHLGELNLMLPQGSRQLRKQAVHCAARPPDQAEPDVSTYSNLKAANVELCHQALKIDPPQ